MPRVLSAAFCSFLVVFCLSLSGCGGGSSQSSQSTPPPSTPLLAVPGQAAPSFFGMHQSHLEGCDPSPLNFPLFDLPAGAMRIWSTCKTQWADLNPSSGQYVFSGLDNVLAALKIKNPSIDAFINLGSTPNWISSNSGDIRCDRANVNGEPPGMCDPPSDLDAVPGSGLGDGTDLAWRNFVTALLQHVTAPGYSASHAHIQFYSIWDEFHRSDTVGTATCVPPQIPFGITCSYRGTFAQMLRMTQDLRCIVEGHPNDPITATGLTCGTSNYTQIGIDPTAQIMEGDAGGSPLDDGNTVMQNYLYCNANPPPGSVCNYGNAGYAATDVISGHSYFDHGSVPEDLMQYVSSEQALDPTKSKLYIDGEGSWGQNANANGDPALSDPALYAAMVPRWYMSLLILGVQRAYWFAWDETGNGGSGGLWSPITTSFPPLQCDTPDNAIGGYYCTGATGYMHMINWLSGATVTSALCPGSCANPRPGIFAVTLTRSGGYQAIVAWDSSPASSCSNPQCGSTPSVGLPPITASQWRDLAGATHSGSPAMLGASPVIIENMAPPSS